MPSDKDILKQFIVEIIKKSSSPLDKKEIMSRGGSRLIELIHNARVEDGSITLNPDGSIRTKSKTPDIRYIENQAFSLVSSGELKEITGSKGAGWGGQFVPTGLSATPTPTPKPTPTRTRTRIEPKPKRKDISHPKDITDEMIKTSYSAMLGDDVLHDKIVISRELLLNPSRFKTLTERIVLSEGLEASSSNISNTYQAILVFVSSVFTPDDIASAAHMTDSSIDTHDLTKKYIKALIETDKKSELAKLSKNLLNVTGYSPTNEHNIRVSALALMSYAMLGEIISSTKSSEPIPEPELEPISLSAIDPRIDLSDEKGLAKRITDRKTTDTDEELIANMLAISGSLDSLVLYLHESKDYYELTPITLRFDKNKKLPYKLWERVQLHQRTGTYAPISPENLNYYHKLKSIMLRLDKITDDTEYATIVGLYEKLTESGDYTLDTSDKTIIDIYFSKLSSIPISKANKERIAKKISILKTLSLSEQEQRIVANIENILEANLIQVPHETDIDNILYNNKSSLPDGVFVGPQYTLVEFHPPISKEEKRLKSIANSIKGSTVSEVVSQVKELLSYPDEEFEKAESLFNKSIPTGFEYAFVYMYHPKLIDPLTYKLIKNLVNKS